MFTILWDNDGVLVDTEGLYFRATQIILQEVGITKSFKLSVLALLAAWPTCCSL